MLDLGAQRTAGRRAAQAHGADQVIPVAKDAKISVDGEAKTLADVKAGEMANVILGEDNKTATAVIVGKKKVK